MRPYSIILMLLCLSLSSIHAQPMQCDTSERQCIESLISTECLAPESSVQSCAELRSLLESSANADNPLVLAYIGASYVLESTKVSDQSRRDELYALAETVLNSALEIDTDSQDALSYLATIESRRGNFQRAADYYRIVYESRPNSPAAHMIYMRYLSLLGEEGVVQTIPLTRDKYDELSQDNDPNRWKYAADLYNIFQSLSMATEAQAFRAEIIETINLDSILGRLSSLQYVDAVDAVDDLLLICNQVVGIIGPEPCVEGISEMVEAVSVIGDDVSRTAMADAATTGIVELGKEASMGRLGADWRDQFDEWIDFLEDSSGESARLYEIRATMTMDMSLKRIYLESSVQLAPEEWHYKDRLGRIYMDLQLYDLAVQQFEQAVSMVSDSSQAANLEGWLERARSAR